MEAVLGSNLEPIWLQNSEVMGVESKATKYRGRLSMEGASRMGM